MKTFTLLFSITAFHFAGYSSASSVLDLSLREGQQGSVLGSYGDNTPIVAEFRGLQFPESTLFHDDGETLFISNINGPGIAKDGNGWIAKIKTNPFPKEVVPWVKGLNAPKGMQAHQDMLWVADIDELIGISIGQGKIIKRLKFPDAKLLNDVAIDKSGTIYVSDTWTSSIYKVVNDKITKMLSSDDLNSPNGISLDGENLIVASYGLALSTWVPKTPGALYSINLQTNEKKKILSADFKSLDGLAILDSEHYLFTESPARTIYVANKKGEAWPIVTGILSPADIGYSPSKKLLAIPRLGEDMVTVIKLETPKPVFNQGPIKLTNNDTSIENGRIKAATCVACHGQSDTAFLPIIKGQKLSYLQKAMADFKSGVRKDPLMGPAAQNLTDQEMKDLAKYYSVQKDTSSPHTNFDSSSKSGKAKAASCVACHGREGISNNPNWPNLAGQRKVYLVKAINEFRSGVRKNSPMEPFVKALSKKEVNDLADYFSSLAPVAK